MKILIIARATLYSVYGGDTVQIISTAKYLRRLGVKVDIKLSGEKIDYNAYDLLHIFNITRPADVLGHIKQSGLPYVVSTIFIDFSEYRKANKGIKALFNKYIPSDKMEYAKAIARWIKNGEAIRSSHYIWYGHRRSVIELAENAAFLLPNSENEYIRFVNQYQVPRPHKVVYNGIDPEIFGAHGLLPAAHDPMEVLCVARIEGNKNQLNLIKALNNTPFRLRLIGKPAPNHATYYKLCRKIAADNIIFEGFTPQEELAAYYLSAKVHVLPSWNETCGLSSMEAAYLNCNIVVTPKGDTTEYYGNAAWYCNPGSPQSIYDAIVKASKAPLSNTLHDKIVTTYNWQQAAMETLSVYEEVLNITTYKKVNAKDLYWKKMETGLIPNV